MIIYLILPAFNEEESLPNLLGRFSALPATQRDHLKIFVVNDGSTDATKTVAQTAAAGLDLTILDHPQNLGLGQAVQTGIQAAIRQGGPEDVMVLMDADDTHDPRLVPLLAQAIVQGADIAIASRFVAGGDDSTAPPLRRLLSRGAALCFKTVLPLDREIHDFTSGFRAYRLSILERAVKHWGERLIEERGFACMVELLLKLRYCHPQIVEVPFQLQYNRKLSTSKIKVLRTILQYLKLALRDRISPPPYHQL
ncbi:glycosyltransferase [Lyngbya confervoides]|uniref:Glycosyltransferase n=1 Tax=Lyngbya confervoides BDU141951 TaxID=1574623 RepID=A0ABD4T7F0_9CYAN|nr:glycosyltransferase [Lyngbya confervoides]MCM1984692.1 glycosyltransferase [Lyngbya confervoides BDU141951]